MLSAGILSHLEELQRVAKVKWPGGPTQGRPQQGDTHTTSQSPNGEVGLVPKGDHNRVLHYRHDVGPLLDDVHTERIDPDRFLHSGLDCRLEVAIGDQAAVDQESTAKRNRCEVS